MDPEDAALLDRLIGRGQPPAQPQGASLQQQLADALASLGRPGSAAGSQIGPDQNRLSQLYADALDAIPRAGGAAPTSDLSFGYSASPFASAAPPDGSSDGAGRMSPASMSLGQHLDQVGTGASPAAGADWRLLSSSVDASAFPSIFRASQDLSRPQPPSKETQAAAAAELQARGLTPQADYPPSENDALANLARGRAVPSWDPTPALKVPAAPRTGGAPPLPTPVIGSNGYEPARGDENTLARMIYAEGLSTPDDFPAIGWSIVNRIGNPQYRPTLDGVLNQRKQYAIVEAGGGPPGGSQQWRETADPSKLTGVRAVRWGQAQQAAQGILSGAISDPTLGAQHFFASPDLDGDAAKAAQPVSPYFT
ncbi:MAG TPA: cell wall hydrolase [Caulobacteraceae bacterium]